MAINGNNNVNHNNNVGGGNNVDVKNRFMDDYINGKTIDTVFLNNVYGDETESNTIINDMENYLKKTISSDFLYGKDKYKGIVIEKSDISYLKSKLILKYNLLLNKRINIEKSILSYLDISTSEKQKLQNELKILSLSELNKLINDENEGLNKPKIEDLKLNYKNIDKFLKKIYGDELPSFKHKGNFNKYLNFTSKTKIELNNIFKNDPELLEVLRRLDSRDKKTLMSVSESDDFIYLTKSNYLTKEEKNKLVLDFLPQISYRNAVEFGFLNDKIDTKRSILKEYYVDVFTDENIEELLKDDNVFNVLSINTSDLVSNNVDIFSNNNFLALFTDKYCAYNNLILENYLSNFDKNINSFRSKLDKLKNVEGGLKFSKGSILIIEKVLGKADNKDKSKEGIVDSNSVVSYIEIISDGSNDGIIKYRDLGSGEINFQSLLEEQTVYESFLKYIESGNKEKGIDKIKKCTIYNKLEIDGLISLGKIKESTVNLDSISETKLDNIISEKEFELVKLKEYKKLEYEGKGYTGEELKSKIDNDAEVIELQENLKNTQEINFNFLKDELRKIDDGFDKFNFGKGTIFSTTKSEGDSFYRIEYLDEIAGKIIISDIAGTVYPVFSFIDFLKIFKIHGGYLTSDINNFNEIFSKILTEDKDTKSGWDKFKYDDSSKSILKKSTNDSETGESTNIFYDYLVADSKSGKGNELIKIHSINGDKVVVSSGECLEKDFTEGEIIKNRALEGKVKSTFSVSNEKFVMNVGELYSRIKKYKLKPRSLDEDNDVLEDKIETAKLKGSFISRYLDRYSIKDVIAGGKIGLDSIIAYLKQTETEHSARFASSVFGSFLPEELKNDLLTRVESEQKKRQDEYVQKLKDVDSSNATDMITRWLENKDCPEYKKEAGMIFMLEKYGVLYAKGLNKKKGSFLWYESMGGKVGDKLYMEKKAEAEANDVPFTEEQLLFVLMFLQCKGDIKPKRRSRLHKDYNRFRNQGKEEEVKTGENDAGARRTIKGRNDYVFGELEGGTYSNGRGGYNKVIDKGGTMKELNEVPFVILFSGICYGYEEKELDQWKDLVALGKLIPITQYLGNTSKMDIFNKTVLEICRLISEEKNDNMYKKAKEIFGLQHKTEGDKDKIKRTRDFYKIYGETLTNALNMLHNKDTGEDSKYSDIIITHKDKLGDREGNSIFQDYFAAFHGGNDFVFDKEEYMTDAFHSAGTFGMDPEKATIDSLALASGPTLRQKNIAKILWNEVVNGFHAKAIRKYNSEDEKRVAIRHQLKGMVIGFLKNAGAGEKFLETYNSDTFLFSRLNDWGIFLDEFGKRNITISNIENMDGSASDLLEQWIDQIIDFEVNNKSYKKTAKHGLGSVSSEIPSVTDDTKGKTYNVLNEGIYLPENY